MSWNKKIFRIYYLFFALLALCALVDDLLHAPNIINYFSYFTILSNYFGACLFLYLTVKGTKSSLMDSLRGAAFVYIVVSGIAYTILLERLPDSHPIPWVNFVLHKIMPFAVVIGWAVFPPLKRLRFSNSLKWLLFPLIYLAYTFLQGLITGWYPYHFLNPNKIGVLVLVYSFVITFSGWLLALGAIFIGNKLSPSNVFCRK